MQPAWLPGGAPPASWKASEGLLAEAKEEDGEGEASPAGPQLLPHQMEALNWLRTRYHAGHNVILADEMVRQTSLCSRTHSR